MLLYGSGLPAKSYWSAALVHSVYLHNCLVHSATKTTPFKGYYGQPPDLSSLKLFGSWVCVKQTGNWRGKLDRHDFTGIFIGYTASNQNIIYIDLDSGLVKRSHHAQFDEAWYLQPHCPLAAQLLYDLGLEDDDEAILPFPAEPTDSIASTPLPPISPSMPLKEKWSPPPLSCATPLPLRELSAPRPLTAAAAMMHTINTTLTNNGIPVVAARVNALSPSEIVSEFMIGKHNMATVYMSPDPYFEAFKEWIDLRGFNLATHRTAGLCLAAHNGWLFLGTMKPNTPGAKIPCWHSCIKGAWLIKIDDVLVSTIEDVQAAFEATSNKGVPSIRLLFSHPEFCPDVSHDGLPIVSSAPFSQQIHDQMNKRWDFATVAEHLQKKPPYSIINNGSVLHYVSTAMKLTQRKIFQQQDWTDWQDSEYLQLNQYEDQGMLGQPVAVTEDDAVFHLVWTHSIKAADG
jgi:hypothetical protein